MPGFDLVVFANNAHKGIARLVKGKLIRQVLNLTRLPVLIVPAQNVPSRLPAK